MKKESPPVIFTPDNEPYLGRTQLFHLDKMIVSTMQQNTLSAKKSHNIKLTDHQNMACQVISQAISIALSIRELIRQGYLFGAYVLVRSLVERAMILLYLYYYPEDIMYWNTGWHSDDKTPGLSKMIDKIGKKITADASNFKGKDILKSLNSLLHAKPDSAYFNMINLDNSRAGFSASKILNHPELCDNLCVEVIPMLAIVHGMMLKYFPATEGSTRK